MCREYRRFEMALYRYFKTNAGMKLPDPRGPPSLDLLLASASNVATCPHVPVRASSLETNDLGCTNRHV